MATWKNTVVTQLGLNLQAKLEASAQLKLTRAVTSTNYVNPDTLVRQTTMTNQKQTLILNDVIPMDGGKAIFPITLTNINLVTGYTLNQIGVFATDPDLGEILYFIAQAEQPDPIPPASELPDFTITYRFSMIKANAGSIVATIDPAALATKIDVVTLQGRTTAIEKHTDFEIGQLTLTNIRAYPHSNAVGTVSLILPRLSMNYLVNLEVLTTAGSIEGVEVYDRQLNGFKIRYSGSAASATIKYYVSGGMKQ